MKKKKPELNSKTARYFLAKQKTTSRAAAARMVGLNPTNVSHVEDSQKYKLIEAHYKDKLLGHISLDEIAEAHAENIRQSDDRGARNTAIKMATDKIEPDKVTDDGEDRVLVILR